MSRTFFAPNRTSADAKASSASLVRAPALPTPVPTRNSFFFFVPAMTSAAAASSMLSLMAISAPTAAPSLADIQPMPLTPSLTDMLSPTAAPSLAGMLSPTAALSLAGIRPMPPCSVSAAESMPAYRRAAAIVCSRFMVCALFSPGVRITTARMPHLLTASVFSGNPPAAPVSLVRSQEAPA